MIGVTGGVFSEVLSAGAVYEVGAGRHDGLWWETVPLLLHAH